MRTVVFCVLALFILSSAARADQADPFLSVAEAKPLREAWQECTAAAAKRGLTHSRLAEAIADSALAACKPREAALVRVLGRRLGTAAGRRIVADLGAYDRLVLIRIIERLRGK
jgi:hypothetical protein